MGSVSAPGGIREPAPSERRTPPNPRSDKALASPLAAPETRRGAIQIFLQAIKKSPVRFTDQGSLPWKVENAAFQELLQGSQRTVIVSSHASPPSQSMDCDGSAALGIWVPRERFAVAKITEFTSPKVRLSQWKAREYRGMSPLVNTSAGNVLSEHKNCRLAVSVGRKAMARLLGGRREGTVLDSSAIEELWISVHLLD